MRSFRSVPVAAIIKTAFISAAAAITLLVTGCGGKDPSAGTGGEIETIVLNSTVVIPENDRLFLWDAEGADYIFGFTGDPPFVDQWRMVAGTAGEGYIRRIYSAGIDGSFVKTVTGRAGLSDLLESGAVSVTLSAGEQETDLSGLSLHGEPGDGAPFVQIVRGTAGYSPDIDLSIEIRGGRVRGISFAAEGLLRADFLVRAELPGSFEQSVESVIASFTSSRTVYTGRLPIVASARLDLVAGIESGGDSIASFELECSASTPLTASCSCSGGAWQADGSADTSMSVKSFYCAPRSQGQIKITIKPVLTVSLYGEPVFVTSFDNSTSFVSTAGAEPYWHWSIEESRKVHTRILPSMIGLTLEPAELDGLSDDRLVSEGPYSNDRYIFSTSWGTQGTGDHGFILPWGIAAAPDGSVVVTDNQADRVRVFAPDSTLIASWGSAGEGPGQFFFPAGAAVDGSGLIYIVDKGNHRVQRFSPSGEYQTEWGGYGEEDGSFVEPEMIAAAPSGEILVTDGYTNRVQAFSPDGAFLFSWGGFGTGPGQFNGVSGIAVSPDGSVYVSECRGDRIQKFDPSGGYILEWGAAGGCPECFDCSIDICSLPGGDVAVTDYGNGQVKIFSGSGQLLSTLGSRGTMLGMFMNPSGSAASPGGRLFVCDSANRRIQVFEPLQ